MWKFFIRSSKNSCANTAVAMKRIEEFSNNELLDELRKRCCPFVFIGHKIEDGGVAKHWADWWGNDEACYGLCHTLAMKIHRQIINEEVNHISGEEENAF